MNQETINRILRLNAKLEALQKTMEVLNSPNTELVMRNNYNFKSYSSSKYMMENILEVAKNNVRDVVREQINAVKKELKDL